MFKFLSKLFGTQPPTPAPAPVVEVKLTDEVATTTEPIITASTNTVPVSEGAAAAPADNTPWPFPTSKPADPSKGEWPFPKSEVVKTSAAKAVKAAKPAKTKSASKTTRKKVKK